MEIVRVNWMDARSIDGWVQISDFDDDLSLIQSCGFLIKENEEALFVSACVAIDIEREESNQYGCTIVIPKKMITDIWRLSDKGIEEKE